MVKKALAVSAAHKSEIIFGRVGREIRDVVLGKQSCPPAAFRLLIEAGNHLAWVEMSKSMQARLEDALVDVRPISWYEVVPPRNGKSLCDRDPSKLLKVLIPHARQIRVRHHEICSYPRRVSVAIFDSPEQLAQSHDVIFCFEAIKIPFRPANTCALAAQLFNRLT